MKELLDNINLIYPTDLGLRRIKRNLNLQTDAVVEVCKKMMLSEDAVISKKGQNYYIDINESIITI